MTERRPDCGREQVEPLPTTCRLCGKTLRTYEQPEGECDHCLRKSSRVLLEHDAAKRGREEKR